MTDRRRRTRPCTPVQLIGEAACDAQIWMIGAGSEPALSKAGGFRLDDPQGQVGIEFMVVTDGSGDAAATYQVPLTYRACALADADGELVGTAEHGVLGRRWIYDEPAIGFSSTNWSRSSKARRSRRHRASATPQTPQ